MVEYMSQGFVKFFRMIYVCLQGIVKWILLKVFKLRLCSILNC